MKAANLLFAATLSLAAEAQYIPWQPPPCVPVTQANPAYPLHVHLLDTRWNRDGWGYQGWGRANLLGDNPLGLEYTFTCTERPMYNAQADEFYQARWKKPRRKMEILMQEVGGKHVEKCDLMVTELDHPYVLSPPRQAQ